MRRGAKKGGSKERRKKYNSQKVWEENNQLFDRIQTVNGATPVLKVILLNRNLGGGNYNF